MWKSYFFHKFYYRLQEYTVLFKTEGTEPTSPQHAHDG